MVEPQAIVPFTISEEQVPELVRQWAEKEVLAPGDFQRDPPIDAVSRVYVPYWAFGAKVRCWWHAESGYYADKDWVRKKRWERRIDWGDTTEGEVEHTFDDVLVPAANGLSPDLSGIEPWPVQQLMPVDQAHLSESRVEPVHVSQADAAKDARTNMDRVMRNTCELAVPGDTSRGLVIQPEYAEETTRLVLVPVWRVQCGYRGKTFEVLVNGTTGKTKGDSPTSVRTVVTITLVLVGLMLGFIALVYLRVRSHRG